MTGRITLRIPLMKPKCRQSKWLTCPRQLLFLIVDSVSNLIRRQNIRNCAIFLNLNLTFLKNLTLKEHILFASQTIYFNFPKQIIFHWSIWLFRERVNRQMAITRIIASRTLIFQTQKNTRMSQIHAACMRLFSFHSTMQCIKTY